MDAIEALKTRRSMRAYNLRPVPREVLDDVLDCARLAPSASNLQPLEYVVVTDAEKRQDLTDLCEFGSFIAQAPVCVVIVARPEGHYLEDAGCAATCLMVAARAHELGSCWVHVHDKPNEKDIAEVIGVPDDRRVICLITLGHGELPPPPPKKTIDEILSWERYGSR